MATQAVETLQDLYEQDETAWLEAMAELARDGRATDLDLVHLAEYLSDMARRDRREVTSRLVVLLAHLLKWVHQPRRRSRSWRVTVIEQRQELKELAAQGVLRTHAEEVLTDAYAQAIERASAETSLPADRFPRECPYSLSELLEITLPEEDA
jgi:hypothetical protein